jgi:hypothetical protein
MGVASKLEIYLCSHQLKDKIHNGTSHKVVGKFNNTANFQIIVVGQVGYMRKFQLNPWLLQLQRIFIVKLGYDHMLKCRWEKKKCRIV